MATTPAHNHRYDLRPPSPLFASPRVGCTVCGFSVPLHMLASRHSLGAIVARNNATQAVRDALDRLYFGKPTEPEDDREFAQEGSRCGTACGYCGRCS